jgi:hypothetical protein
LVEVDRRRYGAAKHCAERAREIQSAIEDLTNERYAGHALQRFIDAWLLLEERKPKEALERLEGAEGLPGMNGVLEVGIAWIRKEASAAK